MTRPAVSIRHADVVSRLRHAERGAAVIIAMLIAALAATVAMAIAAGQQRWLADVAGRRDQAQAQSLAQAGVQWSRAILLEDQAQGAGIDYLGEPWALPLPPIPLDNGFVEGRIVDAQGLINVNNLQPSAAQADATRIALGRLFAAHGIADTRIDALARYVTVVDAGRDARDGDAWYVRQPTPYLRAAAPLVRVAELGAVEGFDDATLARVEADLTAIPAGTPVNVNTAPVAVLAALLGTSAETLAPLASERITQPFRDLADFRNRLPQGVAVVDERSIAVASSYFLVTVRARQGDTVAQARALLQRRPNAWPAVVWQVIE